MPRLKLTGLGDAGIIKDQEGYELPPAAWTDGNNVRMHQGWIGSVSGSTKLIDCGAVPYWITPFYTATTRYLAYAGLSKIYVNDGTTETNITPTPAPTAVASDKWTGGVLSGVLVLNNGRDIPWYYAGTGTATALTAWTSTWRCKSLRPFKQFLISLNITKSSTNYPYMVKWSAAADPGSVPGSWDETDATKDAGEQDLAETPDAIIDGAALGDIFVVYKERSAWGMQYIGGQFIWRFYQLPNTLGMLTQNCVANTPKGHVVLAQGDVYIHTGGETKSLIDQRMRNYLFAAIDDQNYTACFVTQNPRRSEVWVCFPETGSTSCTKALVWNWASDTLSLRDLQNFNAATPGVFSYYGGAWSADSDTWASDTTTWNDGADFNINDSRLFAATAAGQIVSLDTGTTFTGEAITSTATKVGIHADAPERVKLLSRVWPRIDADAGTTVSIEVGASMVAEATPTWQAAQTFTVGTDERVDVFTSGRYLAVRLTSTGQWRMRSLDLDIEQRGAW